MGKKEPANKPREVTKSRGGASANPRHAPPRQQWLRPAARGRYAAEIEGHFQDLFSARQTVVLHELSADSMPIDVSVIYPSEDKPFYVLYTLGMSDLPMKLPEQMRQRTDLTRAELFMLMPKSWRPDIALQLSDGLSPEQYWPIWTLKYLARFPHEYGTWIGRGYTVSYGKEGQAIARGSQMSALILLGLGKEFRPLITEDGTHIRLYMVTPLYREELEFRRKHGMLELDRIFAERGLPLVIDMQRPNYCL